MKNFWETLPRPFFVLAPLANVTDAAFRRVIAKYGKPHAMYTEFVSADGLLRAGEEGKRKLMKDLIFTEAERPIVAQFFTSDIESMEKAAELAQQLGFDGVDINMGCPDRSIEKQGAGAKLILNPERAKELIAAAKRGAPNLPISVKTRLGYNKDILDEWLPEILKAEPVVVTIHARTRKEMSKVAAHWDRVKRAVEIRNEMESKTLIIGNGDVKSIEEAKQKVAETGADGVMIGRGIFGNPWLFNETKSDRGNSLAREGAPPRDGRSEDFSAITFRLRILLEHTKLFEELLGDVKSFAIMKKHFKAYIEGFSGAKELRMKLMDTHTASEVEEVLHTF